MSSTPAIPFLEVKQHNRSFILAKMPAGRLAKIAYAAVRGRDEEPGAVQRLLSPARISSIRQFTLADGGYPTALVLNWTSQDNPLVKKAGKLSFRDEEASAQLIDGQHRLAGIREAIKEKPSLRALELPVAIYEYLNTQQCADIFLSINTEQKPVPRSLVFDLYGVASESVVDPAAVRARDIATFLNEDEKSPYREEIKFPGTPRRRGGIALSTAVSALKPLVEEKGALEQIGITELEMQRVVIGNFFTAIREKYGKQWEEQNNAFLYAAGFMGGIEFFRSRIIPYCNNKESFTVETIKETLKLNASNLILQDEVKGLGGKDAPKEITNRLVELFKPTGAKAAKFEI